MRLVYKLAIGAMSLLVLYLGVTFAQVWMESRRDHAQGAQAIVVFGAAQYDGRPSEVLKARLDHALALYRRRLAPKIVVTGGRQPGDRFTEASVSADYLLSKGVPDSDILRENSGQSSWQSLAATARFLEDRNINEVLLVSDPFHAFRITAMAGELGLEAHSSPTRSSPIGGLTNVRYMARETVAVAVGRLIGYRREARVDKVVRSGAAPPASLEFTHSGVV